MSKARFNHIFKDLNESKNRYRVILGSEDNNKSVNVAQDFIVNLSNILIAECFLIFKL